MFTTDEIREIYLKHFEADGHHLLRSAGLVPANHDPSVLLTTAGMHPLKPYFLGQETPPATRLTSCQKCFRTTDIENVGSTARHLTFFEMLGNFSIGDYFKEGAIEQAWALSTGELNLDPEKIWITVFAGDGKLGLGADEEAISAWERVGVPRERIVELGREDNFWQAGPTGPCGPCSELYLDRGPDFGPDSERPGDDGERFLEFWNLVFMEYEQSQTGELSSLPAKNIDTGMGLNRMAAILQGVGSVYETDQFAPLMSLGRELAAGEAFERSLRILADHSRAMCFLVADGVVPSNEDRGYILRRVMRRAILHGRRLGMEPGFLVTYADQVEALMSATYPELIEQRPAIRAWLSSEEESFGRTLVAGEELLNELIDGARRDGLEGITAADAFKLHDTHGFPIDLTMELVAEHGLGIDEDGFEALMDEQRSRARSGASAGGQQGSSELQEAAKALAGGAAATIFTGYGEFQSPATVIAVSSAGGRALLKLDHSPFYAGGGGQVSDTGVLVDEAGAVLGRVEEVLRIGGDQVLVLGECELPSIGSKVQARVDRSKRMATQANHTATHLLHAALRERLGDHVRQAGSSVAPAKLRFDFTHGDALSKDDLLAIEDAVNEKVVANLPVGATETSLDEARSLGAMALFGEKYGDVVRMVEVGDGDWSRELCGGTHVSSTAEIGLFKIVSEGSSASNVRRIEAITGPQAVDLFRRHDRELREAADQLRTTPDAVADAARRQEQRLRELEREARSSQTPDIDSLVSQAEDLGGVPFLAVRIDGASAKDLPDLCDRLSGKLGTDATVVIAAVTQGRVHLAVSCGTGAIERGVKAGSVVSAAAELVGGGGGGRDNMARAGGKDPERVGEALAAARAAVEGVLGA